MQMLRQLKMGYSAQRTATTFWAACRFEIFEQFPLHALTERLRSSVTRWVSEVARCACGDSNMCASCQMLQLLALVAGTFSKSFGSGGLDSSVPSHACAHERAVLLRPPNFPSAEVREKLRSCMQWFPDLERVSPRIDRNHTWIILPNRSDGTPVNTRVRAVSASHMYASLPTDLYN